MNESLILDNSWLDRSARRGGRYVYAVTSVDASAGANESPMSERARVTYKLK